MKEIKFEIRKYIQEGWRKSLQYALEDSSYSIKLPRPYVPPCYEGAFKTLIYWDAYFTNRGLIQDGLLNHAIDNVTNFFHSIDLLGFVPNGLAVPFFNRSQPPLLTLCVWDIYSQTKDKNWLMMSLPYLEKEYFYWMENRMTSIGLNRYGNSASRQELIDFYKYVEDRLKLPKGAENPELIGSHYLSEAESGWDFTPRFEHTIEHYCPVDLNSILHFNERILSEAFELVGAIGKSTYFKHKAEERLILIQKYLLNPEGIYTDFNYKTLEHSKVITAASFVPYFTKTALDLSDRSKNVLMDKLSGPYGLYTVEKMQQSSIFQWDYPNMWPPLVYFAVQGLLNYGYQDEAKKIAKKYIDTVARVYTKTNTLWEKYDANTGNVTEFNEYEITKMLGWTAGVFIEMDELLKGELYE